jgi:hypothetical protein
MFDFWAFQLHQDDGLLGAKKIVQDPDDFEVELFHLIAGKNRIRVPLHARANLAEGKKFIRFLSNGDPSAQAQSGRERQECEEVKPARL